jgi:hypothetical protein
VKAEIRSNPVYALDLAFFLPLAAVAGFGIVRGNDARRLAFTLLIWVGLMGAGVVGGFILIAINGDSSAWSIGVAIALLSLASGALAAVPLVRSRSIAPFDAPARHAL